MQTEQREGMQRQVEEREIELRDYVNVLRKRLPIIAAIIIVAVAAQVLRIVTAVPEYTASTDILIEANNNNGLDRSYYRYYNPEFLPTQARIIGSEEVTRKVVENLQLDTKYKQFFIPDEKPKVSLFRKMARGLKSTIKSLLPKRKSSLGDGSATLDEMLFSPERYSDADIIAMIIQGGIHVTPVPETDLVTVAFSHENPAIARLVANAVVEAFRSVSLEIKHSASNYSLQWMTEKAAEERQKLEEAETALQKYKRENNLVTVEDRLAVVPEKLSQVNRDYIEAQTKRKEIEDLYQQMKDAGGNISQLLEIPYIENSKAVQEIRKKIVEAKQNIEELSKRYGYKHPTMIKAKDDLAVLNRELKQEVDRIAASIKNSYDLAVSKEKNLDDLLVTTKMELMNVNEKFVQLNIMQREVDANRALYDALTGALKKTDVTEQAQNVQIWVVREASMPKVPSYPRKKKALALGLILGVGLGVGVAFLLEYLDNTVSSEKELTSRYGLTILGSIGELGKNSKYNIESFILRQPLSPVAESYRLVRTNLLLSSAEHPPKTILVTSMNPGEGKTASAINIARVLSQDDKKVAIIDCDLRKPRMHSLFGMDNKVGLSNFLAGNLEGNILFDIPGEKIKLIPSGQIPPNPAELLNSKKMRSLIEKMETMFDFVICDSPPIQRVTESLAISKMADGTIIVVRSQKTTYDVLAAGLKKLNDVNAHVLGFLINGVKDSGSKTGYYSGYDTYYAKE